ncbi:MAG: hypothetical protein ACK5LV_03905 [Lachnospirales bacterium]
MKKFLGLTVALSMLCTNTVPTYAAISDLEAKKLLVDTMENTLERINDEIYEDGFVEEYNSTFVKFLENIRDGHSINFEGNFVFSLFDDEPVESNISFDYNDDGDSILANYIIDDMSGSLFLNDEVLVTENSMIGEKYLYELGEANSDVPLLFNIKYSQVKKYINALIDLEINGEVDEIVADYTDNLVDCLAKADVKQYNDKVVVVVDSKLMIEYLNQLSTKVRNDQSLKNIYESFGGDLFTTVSYEEVVGGIADEFEYMASELENNPSMELIYSGIIQDGIFVNNKIQWNEYNETYFTYEMNFNDIGNGVLSDVDVKMYDDDMEMSYNYSLVNTGDGLDMYLDYEVDGEKVYDYDLKYEINGMDIAVNGEMTMYTEPHFTVTEEPSAEILDYNSWIKEYEDENNKYISDLKSTINLVDEEIERVKSLTSNDLTIDSYSEFYNDYDYFVNFETFETMYNDDNKLYDSAVWSSSYSENPERYLSVSDKDVYLQTLEEFNNYTSAEIENAEAYWNDFQSSSKEDYDMYLEWAKEDYQNELKEYKNYLEFVESGEKTIATKVVINSVQSLSKEVFENSSHTVTSENGENVMSQDYKIRIEESTGDNKVDLKNAININE